MLEKITLYNFKSYKNKTVIDLAKTNYTMLPGNVSESGILKGAIFVGANASGKSNVILAVKLLLDFLFKEREMNSGIFLCLFSEDSKYSIEYQFRIDGHKVNYYFEMERRKSIITEKLTLDDNLMMERMGENAKSYIAEREGVLYDSMDVDKSTLFLRTLFFNTKFASNSILKSWMDFLINSCYVNLFERKMESYAKEELSVFKYIDNSGVKEINSFFDEYNFGQKIEYVHSSKGKTFTIVAGNTPEDKEIFFRREGVNVPIPFDHESLGNQMLLQILPAFLSVIYKGGLLLMDEFSSGFHNELEMLLVKHFMEKSVNSQMLFVSHSTNLLTNSLLRPDQEYAVEFSGEEGSTLKRFSAEKPRLAQNIEKMYVSGVFGGLPMYEEVADAD